MHTFVSSNFTAALMKRKALCLAFAQVNLFKQIQIQICIKFLNTPVTVT